MKPTRMKSPRGTRKRGITTIIMTIPMRMEKTAPESHQSDATMNYTSFQNFDHVNDKLLAALVRLKE